MEKLSFYLGLLIIYLASSFSPSFIIFGYGLLIGMFLFSKGLTKLSEVRGNAINYFTYLLLAVMVVLDLFQIDILELILIPYLIATYLVLYKKEPKNNVKVAIDYEKPFILNGKPHSLFDNLALITAGDLTSGKAIIFPKLNIGYHTRLNVKSKNRLVILFISLFMRKKYSVLVPFKINRATIINLIEKGYKFEEATMTHKEVEALKGKYVNCKKDLR